MTPLRRVEAPLALDVPWSETLTSAAPVTDSFDGGHVLRIWRVN